MLGRQGASVKHRGALFLYGRYKVEDSSVMVPVCANGHVQIALEALAEYERRAAIVVLSEAAEIGGAEIRFARKTVGLTQARLAAVLDVAPETVSRWENDHEPMSRISRLALLAVVRDFPSLALLSQTMCIRTHEVAEKHALNEARCLDERTWQHRSQDSS